MTKLKTTRPLTQLQKVKSAFPAYDETELSATYDMNGNILTIETTNTALITILRTQGLTNL